MNITCLNVVLISSMDCTFRIPLPPPPHDAFNIIGNPILCDILITSSALVTHALLYIWLGMMPWHSLNGIWTSEPLQGIVGTPAACAIIVDPTLSPRTAIDVDEGPKNSIFSGALFSAVGKSGFSDAWPLLNGILFIF